MISLLFTIRQHGDAAGQVAGNGGLNGGLNGDITSKDTSKDTRVANRPDSITKKVKHII